MIINKTIFFLVSIFILIVHLRAMDFAYKTGLVYYNSEQPKKKDKVWDIIQQNSNDYSVYNYTKNLYLIVFLFPLFVNYNIVLQSGFLKEFISKFLIIVFLRSLTIISTILPKNSSVQVKTDKNGNLSLFNKTIGGGGYDKMFSGHFAFGLLISLLLFKYNIVKSSNLNIFIFVFLNILHFVILGITRSHYTMDMIVSLYVTLFVYNLNIQII